MVKKRKRQRIKPKEPRKNIPPPNTLGKGYKPEKKKSEQEEGEV